MRTLDARTEAYLLGRPVKAALPDAVRQAFAGARILITGAGGSVGAELARQVAACAPAELVLFDHTEYLLFRITHELQRAHRDIAIVPTLGDVSRMRDIATACRASRPHFVFHAAACKHVTIAEQAIVPAVRTNVLGAVHTANAAAAVGARFVLVSTDKAAEPRSVMGATKRLAELCVLAGGKGSDALAVRFGNVLGSSGSVVEILLDAGRAGRPLTVTDPDATRFFMTAAEAVSLVLKAAVAGRAGDVFWLDMGRPLRLIDLVERILDVVTPAGAARSPIDVIGLRPGEKLHEELTNQGLTMDRTEDAAIWRARQAPTAVRRLEVVATLRRACARGDAAAALTVLEDIVQDYRASVEARDAAVRHTRLARPARRRRSATPVAGAAA